MSTSIFSKIVINIIPGLMIDTRNTKNGKKCNVQIFKFTMKTSNFKFKGTSIESYLIQLLLKKRITLLCHEGSLCSLLALVRSEFLTLR